MRTLVFTLLAAFVVGACSLAFDAKGSSSQNGPTTDAPQHEVDAGHSTDDAGHSTDDAGHSTDDGGPGTDDAGCNPLDDAGVPNDADLTDAAAFPDADGADANW
jgi:hypothetical protein